MTLDQGWQLAAAWFVDRLEPGWRRKRPDETQALFESIGLRGPFWQLRDVSSAAAGDTGTA
jgi:hypothetical protein